MIKYLRVRAKEITKFINSQDGYTGITITGTVNGSTTSTVLTLSLSKLLSTTSEFFTTECELYITPKVFNLPAFTDGIYNIEISLNKVNGYVLVRNCVFVDITYKCKVAEYLNLITKENSLENTEKNSSIMHLLHYALVNGSNCGCNCDELVKVFKELEILLNTINPQIVKDCGC